MKKLKSTVIIKKGIFKLHVNILLQYLQIALVGMVIVHTSNKQAEFTLEEAMKAQPGSRVQLYSFFILGARWGGWSMPCPGCFTPTGKRPSTGGWVGPRVRLDSTENLVPNRI